MTLIFYVASIIAVAATIRVVTGTHNVHALLYFVVSLLAVAVIFLTLGAPFAAALEVIIYAGAVMVLFVFVVMMLSSGPRASLRERRWLCPQVWIGPGILSAILLAELWWVLGRHEAGTVAAVQVQPGEVGAALFGSYLLAVEMASILLLAGLTGAYHLARHLPGAVQTGKGERP